MLFEVKRSDFSLCFKLILDICKYIIMLNLLLVKSDTCKGV